MEMSGHLHVPPALLRRKGSVYPLARSLGAPQSRCGRCGEEKKFSAPSGNWILVARRLLRSLVVILAEKFRWCQEHGNIYSSSRKYYIAGSIQDGDSRELQIVLQELRRFYCSHQTQVTLQQNYKCECNLCYRLQCVVKRHRQYWIETYGSP